MERWTRQIVGCALDRLEVRHRPLQNDARLTAELSRCVRKVLAAGVAQGGDSWWELPGLVDELALAVYLTTVTETDSRRLAPRLLASLSEGIGAELERLESGRKELRLMEVRG